LLATLQAILPKFVIIIAKKQEQNKMLRKNQNIMRDQNNEIINIFKKAKPLLPLSNRWYPIWFFFYPILKKVKI